jgi:hypothetical protein
MRSLSMLRRSERDSGAEDGTSTVASLPLLTTHDNMLVRGSANIGKGDNELKCRTEMQDGI